MKILVVDNHSKLLPNIMQLVSQYSVETFDIVPIEQFKHSQAEPYDLVVLTGATGFGIPRNFDTYNEEFLLIRERTKPTLGICVGFQAIVAAYGEQLLYRKEGVRGLVDIEVLEPDPIFGGLTSFRAFESHKYYVNHAPPGLKLIARSDFNLEVIKHVSRPIYGFQFHPEMLTPPNNGAQIFKNFFKKVVTKPVP